MLEAFKNIIKSFFSFKEETNNSNSVLVGKEFKYDSKKMKVMLSIDCSENVRESEFGTFIESMEELFDIKIKELLFLNSNEAKEDETVIIVFSKIEGEINPYFLKEAIGENQYVEFKNSELKEINKCYGFYLI